jgi:hypothetical protein
LGATAGLPGSAQNTVGQANRGTRKLNLDRALEQLREELERSDGASLGKTVFGNNHNAVNDL